MGKKKILVVDDEALLLEMMKVRLEANDYEVVTVSDSCQAVDKACQEGPDLIILDVAMPGMDGFEVLERLKKTQDTVATPVIMLSARADEASKIKASQLFDESYLIKPIEPSDLIAKIEEVLKRRGID